jgi:rubrerythrin
MGPLTTPTERRRMFDDDSQGHFTTSKANVEALTAALRDAQMDVARLSEQVRLQRRVLEKLVQFASQFDARGEQLLQEKEIRELLDLKPEQKGAGRVIGKLRCPSCNSVVDDKDGVTNEVCPWCGAQLSSAR